MPLNTTSSGRLDGKVAIITGATGGIGEAAAKQFLREGARVMLVGRSAAKLAETRDRLGAAPGLAHCVAEAADEAAIAAAVATTVATFGGVDLLFANAGTEGKVQPFETLDMADFEAVIRTNVTGVWLSMKHCIVPMRQRGGGAMLAVASIAGVIGFPGMAPYIASKHAVCGLVKTAALELAASRIRVNAIAPGPIENRMMQSLATQMGAGNQAAMDEVLKGLVPMKRYGSNEEVARLATFLLSDEASYCTGGVHMVDGGFVAG